MLKLVNVMWPCVYVPPKWTICPQVFHHHPLNIAIAVVDLLHQVYDVYLLIQYIFGILIQTMVLSHVKNNLDRNFVLFRTIFPLQ